MTNDNFRKSFQQYFYANGSLYLKYYNILLGLYFLKKMKIGHLIARIILTQF